MGVAATRKRYFRLIDLCPGLCFNQLRHRDVVGEVERRVAEIFSARLKKHDWQASVNKKNETQCVWRGGIDFLPAMFGTLCEIGGMAFAGGLF